jgi:hypothetical protein
MMSRFLATKNAAFAEKIMPLLYSGHHSELRNNPLRAARYSSLQGADLEQFFVPERRDLPNREGAKAQGHGVGAGSMFSVFRMGNRFSGSR